jgi:hypothetical protein
MCVMRKSHHAEETCYDYKDCRVQVSYYIEHFPIDLGLVLPYRGVKLVPYVKE